MEKNSFKPSLPVAHYSKKIDDAKVFIKKRMKGEAPSLKTSFKKLNDALFEGLEWNRIITIAGLSGCLSADTIIEVNRGKRSSSRKYTIKELYEKYNLLFTGNGKWNKKIPSYIKCYKEDLNTIGKTQINAVIFSGKKEVFEITTESGKKIKATKDHKFLTHIGNKSEEHYKSLSDLHIGDLLVSRFKSKIKPKKSHYRKSITGKFFNYPNARLKIINNNVYAECLEQRAVYDAYLNGFTNIKDFLIECVNNPSNLIFSDSSMEIHHKDGNTSNNSIDNLELLSKKEHALEHLILRNNMYTIEYDKIISIKSCGVEETYDIMCNAPYNNFIANGIVVHNSGKSLMLSQIKRDIVDYNKDQEFDILSFEMEMLGVDQVARDISSKVELSTKELYSAGSKLTDAQYTKISTEADKMKYYPIYIVDDVGTVEEIVSTILNFVQENQLASKGKGFVCTFDHSLLVKGAVNEDAEKQIIDKLYKTLIQLKKYFETINLKCIFIVLSQLNRDIEKSERITNPMLQYPNKNDLFASSAAYYCSDYVIVTHKPAVIEGIGVYYGPPRGSEYVYGLPVFNPKDPQQAMIYWHILKSRFSSSQILMMVDNFKHSRILEY